MIRVCFPFVGDSVGGSHVSAALLIQGLDRTRVEPLVVLHDDGGPLAPWLRERGLDYVVAPPVPLVSGGAMAVQAVAMLRAAPALAAFLRGRGVAVVHTNDARMHQTWVAAARLAGVPQVWHQRTADDSRRNSVYSSLAAAVLTISEHCRSRFPPAMRKRTTVLYDPFVVPDRAPDRAAARRALLGELNAAADAAIVGFVGNLARQKRPLVFVDAMGNLARSLGRPLVCPIVGEIRAEEGEAVRAAVAAQGLDTVCRLMGPRFPVEPVMAGMDALVAPGVNEGLGRTLVEAMLLGTPVVAARDGGHVEAVRDGETGLLVTPDDADAFAGAVRVVLDDTRAAARMATAARAEAEARFAAAHHCRRVEDLYDVLER
ncbi:MAG: glycosyltransferase family 4 protein [Pseudomonadota bacterium]